MKITKIWFTADYIFGRDEDGKEYSQSLLWYPKLRAASDEERSQYTFSYDGIHWRSLDEDISFESFTYEDSEPSALQRFFLTHKEINVAEFARSIGMNATLLRNYIKGHRGSVPLCPRGCVKIGTSSLIQSTASGFYLFPSTNLRGEDISLCLPFLDRILHIAIA